MQPKYLNSVSHPAECVGQGFREIGTSFRAPNLQRSLFVLVVNVNFYVSRFYLNTFYLSLFSFCISLNKCMEICTVFTNINNIIYT